MRRLSLVLLGCAIALTPSTASAKEITGVSVCAADGCKEVTDESLWSTLAEGGGGTNAPRRALEHFTVEIRVDAEGETVRWSYVAVPSRGLLQAEDGSWMTMTAASRKALLGLTQGRVPLDPGQMPPGKDLPVARVDEVVLPPDEAPARAGGNASAWPWLAGVAALAVVLVPLLVTWRRRDGAVAPGGAART